MVEVMKKVSEGYVKNAVAARKIWPGAIVLDVTLGGGMECLDPAFPIGKVDVPKSFKKALSVMGMWEGLKIFSKKEIIDESYFLSEKKLGKERNCKSYGKLVGVKIGDEVIEIERAVDEIYKKEYVENIKKRFGRIIEGLKRESEKRNVVLLDYDFEKYPVSHAMLIKEMIEG